MIFLPKENLKNICDKYCKDNKLDINNYNFNYGESKIDFNESLISLYNNNNTYNNSNETINSFMGNNNLNINNSIINDNRSIEIYINVNEINTNNINKTSNKACNKKCKIFIGIGIAILIIIGVIVAIIMIKKPKDKKKNLSSNTISPDIKCDSGYYIPDDDPTLKDCQKCAIEGCIKCSGTYNNNICTDCGNLVSVKNY